MAGSAGKVIILFFALSPSELRIVRQDIARYEVPSVSAYG
jgi:hypothetical protein